MKATTTYLIRSKTTGLFRVIAPCDSREHTDDYKQFTRDIREAAVVFGEDVPALDFLEQRGLELVVEMDETLTGIDAIAYSQRTGARLKKYADPIDGAREITVDEAYEIAREDASLVYATRYATR